MKLYKDYPHEVRKDNPNLQAMINMLNDLAKQLESQQEQIDFIMENGNSLCDSSSQQKLKELFNSK